MVAPRQISAADVVPFTVNIGERLRRLANAARVSNPLDAALAAGVTLTASATHDSTLTKVLAVPTDDALFSYHGGTKTRFPAQPWNLFPVSSVAPSTAGNLSGYLSSTPSMQSWTWEVEFMADAPVVELKTLPFTNYNYNIIVDGQFVVSKTGNAPAAYSASQYFKLDFAGVRRARRIQMRGRGPTGFGGVSLSPLSNVWLADQTDALKIAFTGDSYSEGIGLGTPYNPDAGWVHVASHLLGWRDPRQVAVGSTGFLANASNARSKIRDQIPNWGFTPDVIVCAGGFNDSGFVGSDIQAEAILALRAMRAVAPVAPIFVLGPWGGAKNLIAGLLAAEAAVQTAVSQIGDPRMYFVPQSTATPAWMSGSGYTGTTNSSGNSDIYISSDAVHPNDAGHDYLGRRFANAARDIIASLAI